MDVQTQQVNVKNKLSQYKLSLLKIQCYNVRHKTYDWQCKQQKDYTTMRLSMTTVKWLCVKICPCWLYSWEDSSTPHICDCHLCRRMHPSAPQSSMHYRICHQLCVLQQLMFRIICHRWSITFIDSVPTWNKIKIAAVHAMKAHVCKQCAEARETCVGPTTVLQLPMILDFSMLTVDE